MLKETQALIERDADLPSGKELVRIAMQFLQTHNAVSTFRAVWVDGSDNFNQFLTNRNFSGMSNNDAAWQTWSGQNIAQAYGFTQIQNVFPVLYGSNRFIQVNFVRP